MIVKPVGRKKFALYCDDVSLTKQSFKDECDINLIIERARAGMDISHVNARAPVFGDFSNIPSYQESLDFVNKADEMFMALDPKIRERFRNDPGHLLAFLADPANRDEAVRLGILNAPNAAAAKPSAEPAVDAGDKK